LVCKNENERQRLIEHLKNLEIYAVFHYQSLHKSAFYENQHDGRILTQSDRYSECLVRLPFYYELTDEDQSRVIESIRSFYNS
jgi:dTDP-4-amino-4,6-dideoxygalactose transaminase